MSIYKDNVTGKLPSDIIFVNTHTNSPLSYTSL